MPVRRALPLFTGRFAYEAFLSSLARVLLFGAWIAGVLLVCTAPEWFLTDASRSRLTCGADYRTLTFESLHLSGRDRRLLTRFGLQRLSTFSTTSAGTFTSFIGYVEASSFPLSSLSASGQRILQHFCAAHTPRLHSVVPVLRAPYTGLNRCIYSMIWSSMVVGAGLALSMWWTIWCYGGPSRPTRSTYHVSLLLFFGGVTHLVSHFLSLLLCRVSLRRS